MDDIENTHEKIKSEPHRHPIVIGAALTITGLGLLISYWLKLAWIPVWVMGIGLLAMGAMRQATRLILAGGVVTGTGLAIAVQTNPTIVTLPDQTRTGIFLACMAVGWLLITLLTGLASPSILWWPLVPAAVMAVTGAAFWISPAWAKMVCSLVWPMLLVLIGLILVVHWNMKK
jgi:hypothetical protein